jgi:hypothetical protein
MTLTSSEAERIVDNILSSNEQILSAGVIHKSGDIIANKSRESFTNRFAQVDSLEGNRYSGTLAIAALSVANEVKDAFGKPQAIITLYKDCKLMLLPIQLDDMLIGLALERSANVDNETFPNEVESLVTRTLKPR